MKIDDRVKIINDSIVNCKFVGLTGVIIAITQGDICVELNNESNNKWWTTEKNLVLAEGCKEITGGITNET